MLSQSMMTTTAKESAYRIKNPNSRPRTVKAILMDDQITPAFAALSDQDWQNLSIYRVASSVDGFMITAADGTEEDPVNFTETATMIIIFTSQCQRVELAEELGEFFNRNNRMPTSFVLDNDDADHDSAGRLLKALRPYSTVVIHTNDEDYIGSMLTALRA